MDVCCIDKRSSSEPSETINSTIKRYQVATVCYAYLQDVHELATIRKFKDVPYDLERACFRWFAKRDNQVHKRPVYLCLAFGLGFCSDVSFSIFSTSALDSSRLLPLLCQDLIVSIQDNDDIRAAHRHAYMFNIFTATQLLAPHQSRRLVRLPRSNKG